MDSLGFEIDPEIARASTPPGSFYTDPAILERARERVFAPSWQLAADLRSLEAPGSVQPVRLHPGWIDEPIVLARDPSGALHGLSNVCTHRANLIVREPGKRQSLVCGYHGRRFDLDGRFKTMPGFERAQDFPRPSDDLPRVPVATWGPLVFASLEAGRPFEAWTGALERRMSWFPKKELLLDPARSRDYDVAANWALYCDNYLEGFHIPFVHPALNASLSMESYVTEIFESSSVQIAVAKPGEEAFELPPDSPEHGRRIAGYYWFLFPNLMLNFYPWGISINVVRPLAVDRTRVSFLSYVGRPEKLDRGAGADLDRVEHEDEAVVEGVQQGVRSRLYTRGRYSPDRERGVHHFHRMLTASLR
ncbi:MAG: aromatic ring-hydroxylating oxygenase subunit alpha [Planctomycetota bacterium]